MPFMGGLTRGFTNAYARDREREETQLIEMERTRRSALREQYNTLAERAKDPQAREFYLRQGHLIASTPLTKKLPKGADSIDYLPKPPKKQPGLDLSIDEVMDIDRAYSDEAEGAGGMNAGTADADTFGFGGPPPAPRALGMNFGNAMERMEGGISDDAMPLSMNTGRPVEQANVPTGGELIARSPIFGSLQEGMDAALAQPRGGGGAPAPAAAAMPPAPPPQLYDAFGGLTPDGEREFAKRDAMAKMQLQLELAKQQMGFITALPEEERALVGMLPGFDNLPQQRQWKGQLVDVIVGGQPTKAEYDFNSRQYLVNGQPVIPDAIGRPQRVEDMDMTVFYAPNGQEVLRVPSRDYRVTGTWEIDQITGTPYWRANTYGTVGGGGGVSVGGPGPQPGAPAQPPGSPGMAPAPTPAAGGAPPAPAPIAAGGPPAPPPAVPTVLRRPSPFAPQKRGPGRPSAWTVVTKPSEVTVKEDLGSISKDFAALSGGMSLESLPSSVRERMQTDLQFGRMDYMGDEFEYDPSSPLPGALQLRKEKLIDRLVMEAFSGNRPIDKIPERYFPYIAARGGELGLIQIDAETKENVAKFSEASAALDLLDEHLQKLLKADSPKERMSAFLQYESMAAALTRLVGRAAGEKGVFTNQDAQDMRAMMAIGSMAALAIALRIPKAEEFFTNIANERISRAKRLFENSQTRKFHGTYSSMKQQMAMIGGMLAEDSVGAVGAPEEAGGDSGRPPAPPAAVQPGAPNASASAPTYKRRGSTVVKLVDGQAVEHSLDGGKTWQPGPAPQ